MIRIVLKQKSAFQVFASMMILVPPIRVRTQDIRTVFRPAIHQDILATVPLLRAGTGINAKTNTLIIANLTPDIAKS